MCALVGSRLGRQARDATGSTQITVLADRGYFSGAQVLECEGSGVLPCVPKIDNPGKAQPGFFTKADFVYDASHNHYTCPAGACLTKGRTRSDHQGELGG